MPQPINNHRAKSVSGTFRRVHVDVLALCLAEDLVFHVGSAHRLICIAVRQILSDDVKVIVGGFWLRLAFIGLFLRPTITITMVSM